MDIINRITLLSASLFYGHFVISIYACSLPQLTTWSEFGMLFNFVIVFGLFVFSIKFKRLRMTSRAEYKHFILVKNGYICNAPSNVSSQGPSSEQNLKKNVSLWGRALARNVRPHVPYISSTLTFYISITT